MLNMPYDEPYTGIAFTRITTLDAIHYFSKANESKHMIFYATNYTRDSNLCESCESAIIRVSENERNFLIRLTAADEVTADWCNRISNFFENLHFTPAAMFSFVSSRTTVDVIIVL